MEACYNKHSSVIKMYKIISVKSQKIRVGKADLHVLRAITIKKVFVFAYDERKFSRFAFALPSWPGKSSQTCNNFSHVTSLPEFIQL